MFIFLKEKLQWHKIEYSKCFKGKNLNTVKVLCDTKYIFNIIDEKKYFFENNRLTENYLSANIRYHYLCLLELIHALFISC